MKIGLDLDGTLITCKEKHVSLMAIIAKAFSIELDIEIYWALKKEGHSNFSALEVMGLNKFLVDKLNKQWCISIENLEWGNFDSLFPDTIIALDSMKSLGYSLHLISARNAKNIAFQQLRHLNLLHFFDSIDFVSNVRNEKKSFFMQKQNIDIYIGDTEADFESAKSSGVECFLVTSGMRSDKYLSDYSCYIYKTIVEAVNEI